MILEAENEDVGTEDGDITDGQNEVNTNEDEKGDNGMVNVNRDDITDNLGNTESLQSKLQDRMLQFKIIHLLFIVVLSTKPNI